MANGDEMCATVTLTLFKSQCPRAHNLSMIGSMIAGECCNENEDVIESGVYVCNEKVCLNACLLTST